MKEFIEKLISRLEEYKTKAYVTGITNNAYEFGACNGMDSAIKIINELAEEYKGGWISCSERLPENTDLEYFLVWCKGYFTEGTHIGEECQWYGIGLLYNKNKWEVYQCKDIKDIEVIAWQPLPEPYKEGVTDNE